MEIKITIPNGITRKDFKNIVDEICTKGIGNGCFQDYAKLSSVLDMFSQIERSLDEV